MAFFGPRLTRSCEAGCGEGRAAIGGVLSAPGRSRLSNFFKNSARMSNVVLTGWNLTVGQGMRWFQGPIAPTHLLSEACAPGTSRCGLFSVGERNFALFGSCEAKAKFFSPCRPPCSKNIETSPGRG
jgi:hypothetical protein